MREFIRLGDDVHIRYYAVIDGVVHARCSKDGKYWYESSWRTDEVISKPHLFKEINFLEYFLLNIVDLCWCEIRYIVIHPRCIFCQSSYIFSVRSWNRNFQ